MRILIAVHHFPPKYTGGTEWEAYRIARNLISKGHIVFVICVEKENEVSNLEHVTWNDDTYDGIPVRRISIDPIKTYNQSELEYDNVWIARVITELANEFKPDIFHLFSGYLITGRALRSIKQLGIPTVITLNDYWFLCKRITLLRSDGELSDLPINPIQCAQCLGEERRRYRYLGKAFPGLMKSYWSQQTKKIAEVQARLSLNLESLNEANAIIVRSQFLRDIFINLGIDSSRFYSSRQGLEATHFNLAIDSKIPSNILRLDYLGQIVWHKGVHVLIKALSLLPNLPVKVRIFGKMDPSNDYSHDLLLMAENDKRIIMAGHYGSPQELDEIYKNNDAIVVPSIWYENSPNVILEAFARHTPVITSNLGGMAELVQHQKNGLLFEFGNPQSLADQIRFLVENPQMLPRLKSGIGSIKRIEEEILELEGIYSNIVTAKMINA